MTVPMSAIVLVLKPYTVGAVRKVAMALTVSRVAFGKHRSTLAGSNLTTVITAAADATRALAFATGSTMSGQVSDSVQPGALPPQWMHAPETRMSDKKMAKKKKSVPNDETNMLGESTRRKELVR